MYCQRWPRSQTGLSANGLRAISIRLGPQACDRSQILDRIRRVKCVGHDDSECVGEGVLIRRRASIVSRDLVIVDMRGMKAIAARFREISKNGRLEIEIEDERGHVEVGREPQSDRAHQEMKE